MNNFKRIGLFDVAPPTEEITMSNLWDWLNLRKMFPASGHYDVKDIVMRFHPVDMPLTQQEVFDSNATVSYFPWYHLKECRALVERHCPEGYVIGRVLVAMLLPGGVISSHVDEGKYADNHERYHFVLHSNPYCTFICGNEATQMRSGEIWTFNHKIEHQVINADKENPRVHIIADYRKVEQDESNDK